MKKTISKFKLPKMTILVLMILLLSGIVFAERETTSWSFLKDKIWNTGDGVTVKTWHGLLDKITDLEENGGGGKFVDGLSSTDAVFMDGNVGIGTDNPTAKLEVHGSIWAHSSIGASRSDDSGNIYLGLNEGSNKSYEYGDPNIIRYGGSGLGANSLAFEAAGNVETMRIQDGKVGIGTDSPRGKLEVVGGVSVSGADYPALIVDNTSTKKAWFLMNRNTGGEGLHFNLYGSTSSGLSNGVRGEQAVLFLGNNGNVGIGKSNPTAKLEVNGEIKSPNKGATAFLGRMTSANSSAGWNSYSDGANSVMFDCSSTKSSGYCVALKSGAFISHFNNGIPQNCYWYLKINNTTKIPYALNYTGYSGANKMVGGYANVGDKVGWWRQNDPSYNGNCSRSSQENGFTLIGI